MNVISVGQLAEQIRGVTYQKGDAIEAPKRGYSPILRAGNLGDEGLDLEDLLYVPDAKISQKQRLRPHDVVIASSSGSLTVVGKAVQIDDGFVGSFGAFCKVLRPKSGVDPRYFGHFFRTSGYRRIVSLLAEGANINNLRNQHLDDLQFPLPSILDQKRIASILDAADALRALNRRHLQELDTLFASLQSGAFRGEL